MTLMPALMAACANAFARCARSVAIAPLTLVVMIGFGSIGRGTLPLLERHIAFDRSKFVVIEWSSTCASAATPGDIARHPDRSAPLRFVASLIAT